MKAEIFFTQVSSRQDIDQILELQAINHVSVVDAGTMATDGFVTVRHEPGVLRRMNEAFPSVIAKSAGRVVGYCLVMPRSFGREIPELIPMFDLLDGLTWNGKRLGENPDWFVMGQVCVDAGFRGQGVFDGMYRKLREVCAPHFEFVVTEIAERNRRSFRAHERVGFQSIHTYPDNAAGEIWEVVLWDWR